MDKRFLTLLPTVVLVAVVVSFAVYNPIEEPTLDLNGRGEVPGDPTALDGWLAAREARFDDITPGAEKHIAWADPAAPARTPLSIVYLHGFSATRQEVAPLAEQVALALGANLFLTRLRGHGRGGEAFAEASVADWAEDGREALAIGHTLGDRVVVMGTSTGGTLATWMAAKGAALDALVLVSPNFAPKDGSARILLWPGRSVLLRLAIGPTRSWEPQNDEQARYWTHEYPASALFPMMELVGLVGRTDLSAITAPVLAIYAPDDQVIRGDLVPVRVGAFGSPTQRLLTVDDAADPSQHVIAGRILSPNTTDRLTDEVVDFVGEVLPAAGVPAAP